MPLITVFCPFTRPELVYQWFECLYTTDLDPASTNLCFIVDCDEPKIYARIMDHMNMHPFRKFMIIRNYDHHVNPINIPIRRKRIAEIHEQVKDVIASLDGEYVFGLEDDTVFTGLQVHRLLEPFSDIFPRDAKTKVGFVTAYEAGRWQNKIIGAWNFDNVEDPKECWTLLPDKGYEEIDAAGFYCYLTPTDLFVKAPYTSEIWQPWGPDVNYGLWLRKQGYSNYVDWEQPCGHYDQGIIIQPMSQLYSEHFWFDPAPEFPNGMPQWIRRKQPV